MPVPGPQVPFVSVSYMGPFALLKSAPRPTAVQSVASVQLTPKNSLPSGSSPTATTGPHVPPDSVARIATMLLVPEPTPTAVQSPAAVQLTLLSRNEGGSSMAGPQVPFV